MPPHTDKSGTMSHSKVQPAIGLCGCIENSFFVPTCRKGVKFIANYCLQVVLTYLLQKCDNSAQQCYAVRLNILIQLVAWWNQRTSFALRYTSSSLLETCCSFPGVHPWLSNTSLSGDLLMPTLFCPRPWRGRADSRRWCPRSRNTDGQNINNLSKSSMNQTGASCWSTSYPASVLAGLLLCLASPRLRSCSYDLTDSSLASYQKIPKFIHTSWQDQRFTSRSSFSLEWFPLFRRTWVTDILSWWHLCSFGQRFKKSKS